MMRLTSPKAVQGVVDVIQGLGGVLHLGESRSLIVVTPEDLQRLLEAARVGGAQGVQEFMTAKVN